MIHIGGKIPITIFPIFLIVAGIIGWLSSGTIPGMLVWMVVIIVSVFVHECGHALTAVAFGQNARIELMGFGGLTHRKGKKLHLWQEFLVVLNGPCAGFLLGLVAYFFLESKEKIETLLKYGLIVTVYVNFFWTFLNLMPVYPLDGGHLMSIVFQGIFGFRGLRYSLFLSMIFAGFLSLFFFTTQQVLAGSILLLMAFESYRTWKETAGITDSDQNEKLQNELSQAEEMMIQGHYHRAFDLLETVRIKAKEGVVYTIATEDMAKVLEELKDYEKAYELLESIQKKLSPEGLRLFHHLCFHTHRFALVVSLGDRAFQIYPSYEIAVVNALSYAALRQVEQAIGWLQRAIHEGAPVRETLQRREIDEIRNDPAFQEWVHNLEISS